MTTLHALILGIVEGLTEFLPISSTAHLMLASKLMGLENLDLEKSNFLSTFIIVIQLGAILAVVVLYWRALLVNWQVFHRIALAFVPTGIIALLLYKTVKTDFLKNHQLALWALAVGGVLLILFEMWHREKPDVETNIGKLSYRNCILIGCFQVLAMIPGVSRAAATILGGLALGMKRKTAVEFSFLLAVPTMAAATAWELRESYNTMSFEQGHLLGIGFVTSFVVAMLSIVFLLRYIRTHTFVPFGIYRIILAVVLWIIFALEIQG